MSDMILQKQIGALIDMKPLASSLSWTAGGASDSVTWTGFTIDRGAFPLGSLPLTLDAAVFFNATLASGSTLSLYWDVQHASNTNSWVDYATEAVTVVATGPSGGGAVVGVSRLTLAPSADNPNIPAGNFYPAYPPTPSINLASALRYIRVNVVPHMGRTGTDTAVIAAVGVFAGFQQLDAPVG